MRRVGLALLLLSGCQASPPPSPVPEDCRYFRLTPGGPRSECAFTTAFTEKCLRITSRTGALTVTSCYEGAYQLLEAAAGIGAGEPVRVTAGGGRATVIRPGHEAQEFDAPPGLIVTSAPDWTDALLICTWWQRGGAPRQEFAGLWIHPEKPAQRLTFSAERIGDGEPQRLTLRLRGNSLYAVWIDSAGRMIKLVSLPAGTGSTVLVREGFEAVASSLRPE